MPAFPKWMIRLGESDALRASQLAAVPAEMRPYMRYGAGMGPDARLDCGDRVVVFPDAPVARAWCPAEGIVVFEDPGMMPTVSARDVWLDMLGSVRPDYLAPGGGAWALRPAGPWDQRCKCPVCRVDPVPRLFRYLTHSHRPICWPTRALAEAENSRAWLRATPCVAEPYDGCDGMPVDYREWRGGTEPTGGEIRAAGLEEAVAEAARRVGS